MFNFFKEAVENETNLKIKCLRLSNGGEYTSNEFEELCEKDGIRRNCLVSRAPQQNGVKKRKKHDCAGNG